MQKSEFLRRVWRHIDSSNKWVAGHYHIGNRFCMVGAINHESGIEARLGVLDQKVRDIVIRDFKSIIRSACIQDYNDSHSWYELRDSVMELLKRYDEEEAQTNPVATFKPELRPQEPKVVRVQPQEMEAEKEKEFA